MSTLTANPSPRRRCTIRSTSRAGEVSDSHVSSARPAASFSRLRGHLEVYEQGKYHVYSADKGYVGSTLPGSPLRPLTDPTRTRSPARRMAITWVRVLSKRQRSIPSAKSARTLGRRLAGAVGMIGKLTWSTSTNQLHPFRRSLPCPASGGTSGSLEPDGEGDGRLPGEGRYLSEPGKGSGRERRCRWRWLTCQVYLNGCTAYRKGQSFSSDVKM